MTSSIDQQFKALRDTRPSLQAGILSERGGYLTVPITNSGAPATVWAKLTIAGNTLNPRSNVYATWRGAITQEIWLGSGETHEVIIARPGHLVVNDVNLLRFYYWVPFIENGERDETRASNFSWPNDPNPESRLYVTIGVYSRPESTAEPIVFSLTLVGCDRWEDVQGVNYEPPQEEERQDDPGPDPWTAFHDEAEACVRRFHELAERDQISTEDWCDFIIHIANTRVRALRLPESESFEACVLLQPILETRDGNLMARSGNIAQLQSFLLRRQLGEADS